MEEIQVKAKKWGNSLGILIPSGVVSAENIEEGTELSLKIQAKHKTTVKDIFSLAKKHPLPKLKTSVAELMKEVDKELWGE